MRLKEAMEWMRSTAGVGEKVLEPLEIEGIGLFYFVKY